jgi:outer membrane protein assembly factor BamB
MDFNVYALDAKTGAKLWSYNVGDYLDSSPTVANGMVYIGCNNGKVYAFGLPDGDRAKQGAASERPNLKALRPDSGLEASK